MGFNIGSLVGKGVGSSMRTGRGFSISAYIGLGESSSVGFNVGLLVGKGVSSFVGTGWGFSVGTFVGLGEGL